MHACSSEGDCKNYSRGNRWEPEGDYKLCGQLLKSPRFTFLVLLQRGLIHIKIMFHEINKSKHNQLLPSYLVRKTNNKVNSLLISKLRACTSLKTQNQVQENLTLCARRPPKRIIPGDTRKTGLANNIAWGLLNPANNNACINYQLPFPKPLQSKINSPFWSRTVTKSLWPIIKSLNWEKRKTWEAE